MSALETARQLADPFGDLGGRFMLNGRTYARGAELGFNGIDFYFCGRAGVLGDVDAEVVVHELGFFEPANVTRSWAAGREVMAPADAAREFMACGYEWGRARLPEGLDAARLAALVHKVTDAAPDRSALSSAWRRWPWPTDERDAALHAIHLMRELRGGAHVSAVHDIGLDPHAAVMVRSGAGGAEFFGWSEPHPDPDAARAQWQQSEDATDRAIAAALGALDDDEQAELVELARAAVPT